MEYSPQYHGDDDHEEIMEIFINSHVSRLVRDYMDSKVPDPMDIDTASHA